MRVQEVVTEAVCSCSPATNAAEAAEPMWTHNCGSLPVVEDGGRVIGMVTDRDLFIALGTRDRKAAGIPVGEVMRSEVGARRAADSLDTALKTMADNKVYRLPVVNDGGKLQGILSIDDIAAQSETDSISGAVVQTLKTISGRSAAAGAAAA